jgi:hypothetical protein
MQVQILSRVLSTYSLLVRTIPSQGIGNSSTLFRCTVSGYRILANSPIFQIGEQGSIPCSCTTNRSAPRSSLGRERSDRLVHMPF